VKRTRVAIIGTGQSIGNHLEALRALQDRAELVAMVDLDGARVRNLAQQHEVPAAYTDADEMLRSEKPDLVHIVTPPATHLPLTLAALQAGAWVLCEKPLCASLAEFDAISAAEAASGCYVRTVFQWRFGAAAQHLKQLIGEGALGRPLVGTCNTLWYRNADYYAVPWRGRWATEIGGPSATLGIHLMDLCLWLLGDWAEVHALIGTLDRQIEVEDVSLAQVRFENGALASFINSALSPRQTSHLRLDFQHATAEVEALYRYGNEDWRVTLPDGAENRKPLERWQALDHDTRSSHAAQLTRVLDSLERGERPPVSGPEARRILEFLASLYKSALAGTTVARGSITPADPFYYAMNGRPAVALPGTAALP
jgi:predicted dehydrogenase